jgi:hypothetical protein
MNYNPHAISPDRYPHYDEFHPLGIHGDSVLPEMPLGRETSGGSHIDGSESESIGQTWRSVDDMTSLDPSSEPDRIRSRVQSEDLYILSSFLVSLLSGILGSIWMVMNPIQRVEEIQPNLN